MTGYLACILWTRYGCLSAAVPGVCLNSVSPVIPLPAGLLPGAGDARTESVKHSFC